MKEKYQTLEMGVVEFASEDVITTSAITSWDYNGDYSYDENDSDYQNAPEIFQDILDQIKP